MLDDHTLRAFARDGYIVVPESLLAAADAEIDALASEEPPPEGAGHGSCYR